MRYRYQRSQIFDSEETPEGRIGAMLKTAFVFGAVFTAAAVLAAPMLQDVGQRYAQGGKFGVDRTYTGSITKPERYRLRQSVLVPGVETICETPNAKACRK